MKIAVSAVLAAVLSAGAAVAGDAVTAADTVARIKSILSERFPEIPVVAVRESGWPGMYEVQTDGDLAYTNEDASLLFAGRVLDTKTHEDLTARRLGEIAAIDFSSLPQDLALRRVKGDGRRKLAIFADPECPYCRQFEKTLAGIDNVTVYTYLVAFESIHPEAPAKARRILCSADPSQAWERWMLNDEMPAEAPCKSDPLAALQALGERLNVASTPTIFFENGFRIPGAIDAARLERELTRASAATVASHQR